MAKVFEKAGAAAMALSSLTVVGNAALLNRFKREEKPERIGGNDREHLTINASYAGGHTNGEEKIHHT